MYTLFFRIIIIRARLLTFLCKEKDMLRKRKRQGGAWPTSPRPPLPFVIPQSHGASGSMADEP